MSSKEKGIVWKRWSWKYSGGGWLVGSVLGGEDPFSLAGGGGVTVVQVQVRHTLSCAICTIESSSPRIQVYNRDERIGII